MMDFHDGKKMTLKLSSAHRDVTSHRLFTKFAAAWQISEKACSLLRVLPACLLVFWFALNLCMFQSFLHEKRSFCVNKTMSAAPFVQMTRAVTGNCDCGFLPLSCWPLKCHGKVKPCAGHRTHTTLPQSEDYKVLRVSIGFLLLEKYTSVWVDCSSAQRGERRK